MQFANAESKIAQVAKNGNLQKELFFQPKLTINPPNDIYEQEADAMADKVMRIPTNS